MRVAVTRHVLRVVNDPPEHHRQVVAVAAGAVAVVALGLAVRDGSLAGFGLVVALVAVGAATALGLRLRQAERSHAALTVAVADLAARLDRLTARPESELSAVAPSAGALVPDGPPIVGPVASDHDQTNAVADASCSSADSETTDLAAASPGDFPLVNGPVNDAPTHFIGEVPTDVAEAESLALPSGSDHVDDLPVVSPPPVPETMPAFALTSLNGVTMTDADLTAATPSVVVFWRPGCPHCQRLTPELVAWESLQGPRLVVFAACDGPTAFRAGLPGLVILDPGFTVGQAIGAPGTPAALSLDAAGRPAGPLVAGASTVTALLLDAMRDWASNEPEPLPQLAALDIDADEVSAPGPDPDTAGAVEEGEVARPTVLLRRVKELPSDQVDVVRDWDADSVIRRAG